MPLPKLPKYNKNSLRPNPHAVDPWRNGERPELRFASETILVGDFGSWDADAGLVNGLPSTKPGRSRRR